jgi:hypothetical protein
MQLRDMTRLYDHHDEAMLVELVLAGDREAFNPFVDRYYPGILRLCNWLLGSVTDAEDVAQEAMVQAYLGLSGLRSRENPGRWMYAIAANQGRMVYIFYDLIVLTTLIIYNAVMCG